MFITYIRVSDIKNPRLEYQQNFAPCSWIGIFCQRAINGFLNVRESVDFIEYEDYAGCRNAYPSDGACV